MITAADEKKIRAQLKALRALAKSKKWDVGLLATATLPFFLEELVVLGAKHHPEIRQTFLKLVNANLNRAMVNAGRALKE